MRNLLQRYKGEPIAVFCARYIYRGILAEIGDDAILLTDPTSVEVTGSATKSQPTTEDPIPSDLIISLGSVEIICQPTWVFHGLGKKSGTKTAGKAK